MQPDEAVGLDLEYLLLGCALRYYGSKLLVSQFPSEARDLSEEPDQLETALNRKCTSAQDLGAGNDSADSFPTSAATTAGMGSDEVFSKVAQIPRCPVSTSKLQPKWEAGSRSMHRYIIQHQRLTKLNTLEGHEALAAALAEAAGGVATGKDSSTLIGNRIDAKPHHVFLVAPHRDGAPCSPLTTRVRREYEAGVKESRRDSTLAFHGSPTHNWYSILQNGFRNKCREGVLFGHGIYFSTALHVSQDFANFETSPFSSFAQVDASATAAGESSGGFRSSTIRVIGVCEIAHTESTRSHDNDPSLPKSYLVVKNPSHVALKYLLVFEGNVSDVKPPAAAAAAAAATTSQPQQAATGTAASGGGVGGGGDGGNSVPISTEPNSTAAAESGGLEGPKEEERRKGEDEKGPGQQRNLQPERDVQQAHPPPPTPPPPPTQRRTTIIVVVVVLLALGVRWYGDEYSASYKRKLQHRRNLMS